MNRRTFLRRALAASLTLPGPAMAQSRVPRVGSLFSFTPATGTHFWET